MLFIFVFYNKDDNHIGDMGKYQAQ